MDRTPPEVGRSGLNTSLTRRKFLKNTAVLGAGAAAGVAVGIIPAARDKSKGQTTPQEASPASVLVAPAATSGSEYLSPQQIRERYRNLIEEAAKAIERITIGNNNPLKIDASLVDIMEGIIFVESSGRTIVTGSDEDRGLCQITPMAETDAKQRLTWGEIDISEPGINITLGLTYLAIQMERFNNPVLAISAYNKGQGVIQEFVDRNKGHIDAYKNPGIQYYNDVMRAIQTVKPPVA